MYRSTTGTNPLFVNVFTVFMIKKQTKKQTKINVVKATNTQTQAKHIKTIKFSETTLVITNKQAKSKQLGYVVLCFIAPNVLVLHCVSRRGQC